MKTRLFFLLYLFLFLSFEPAEFKPIHDAYVSPNHLYLSKQTNEIYIGLSTYSGVAVYNLNAGNISKIITMEGPVEDVIIDEQEKILYAASGMNGAELYVYDIEKNKGLKSINVGNGPTELALCRSLNHLYVANRFSNDISVVDTKQSLEIGRIKAVREPFALALSPDESLLAVANLLPDQPSISRHVASKITLIDTREAKVIRQVDLPNGGYAVKDIVFSNDGKYVYATHLLGRYNLPTNQIEKGWINTNALSIIDVNKMELYNTVLLDDIYKGAANPHGLNITEDGKKLMVAISGTSELFVIDRLKMHDKLESTRRISYSGQSTYVIGESGRDEIPVYQASNQLEPMEVHFEEIRNELSFLKPVRKWIKLKSKGPRHIVDFDGKVFITSYFSDGLEILDLNSTPHETDFIKLGDKDLDASDQRKGEWFFHSADNCFQQWQSCASCHPGEGRVDGLNWDLLNDGIGNPKNTRSLLFSHFTPPTTATGIRKDAETSVRAGFKHIQFIDIAEEDARAVDTYLKSLKPVTNPNLENGKFSDSAANGEKVFTENGCNHCHSGPYFTNLQQYGFSYSSDGERNTKWDTPTLVELWRTAPYLHDGRYYKLEDVFTKGKHALEESLAEDEVRDLIAYLLSL